MRILALIFLALPALAADPIEALGYKWKVPAAPDWAVTGSGPAEVFKMLVEHPDKKELPRRPLHFAVAQTDPYQEVTLDVEVKRLQERGSVVIVYAWKDENHFNYAHLHPDSPEKQPVHSGIFHVYAGDRVRISAAQGEGTLPSGDWTPVHLTYSARTHLCEVTVSGHKFASLRAVDLSLGAGQVGLGSFFNAAEFRHLKIQGK